MKREKEEEEEEEQRIQAKIKLRYGTLIFGMETHHEHEF